MQLGTFVYFGAEWKNRRIAWKRWNIQCFIRRNLEILIRRQVELEDDQKCKPLNVVLVYFYRLRNDS